MNSTIWQLILIIFAYIVCPGFIGWSVSMPKTIEYGAAINIFYTVVFIMFFVLGAILKYHLGR